MKLLKFIFGLVCFIAIIPVFTAIIYLKVLPAAVGFPAPRGRPARYLLVTLKKSVRRLSVQS